MLKLFNTLTRKKEEFIPLKKGKVGMYTCGPTVYDYPHIGNLRAYVFADILRRVLESNKLKVEQVMNITDVGHLTSDSDEGEDKVEAQSKKTGKSAKEITEFFTEIFVKNLEVLNIKKPNIFCKATDHIKDQIALVKVLEKNGYTYKISDGIYFDTSKISDYGKLARLNIKGMKAGARVELNSEKKNITDFALWKFSPTNSKRQMEWESSWGTGFPGWHIECSAMAMKYLGETLDIHTGGIDHIPVHHTNEIAQSESATGKKFVNYWLHCAFLKVEGKKMSKSLGNIFTIDDIIAKGFDPLSFRYLLLTASYRAEMNFTWDSLKGAKNALNSIKDFLVSCKDNGKVDDKLVSEFQKCVNDDLDTPKAIAHIWKNIISSKKYSPETKKATIIECDKVLGLSFKNCVFDESKKTDSEKIPQEILSLLAQRENFRKEKKWEESDVIRKKIEASGFVVEDTPDGAKIKKLSTLDKKI
jgi:cysteinyl-tRNA synthetase